MPPTTFPPNIDIISQPHQDTSPVHVGIGIPKHLHPPPFLICVRFVWTCCSVCLSLHPLSSSTTNPVISRREENSSQLMLKEAFVTLWSPHLPLALLAARDYGLAFTCPCYFKHDCTLKPSLVCVVVCLYDCISYHVLVHIDWKTNLVNPTIHDGSIPPMCSGHIL